MVKREGSSNLTPSKHGTTNYLPAKHLGTIDMHTGCSVHASRVRDMWKFSLKVPVRSLSAEVEEAKRGNLLVTGIDKSATVEGGVRPQSA